MNKHGVILLALLAVLPAAAQFTPTAQSARQGALGGCLVALPTHTPSIGIGWHQGFLAQGLATKTLSASVPLGERGTAFGKYTHFGDAIYHEQQATAGAGLAVNDWLTAGVYAIYSHIGTNDAHYDHQQWLDGGIALQAVASKSFSTYLTVYSRRWDTARPVGGRLGAAYRPADGLLTVAELAADERTRFRCGMEYTYNQRIAARIGLATNPVTLTFGAGYADKHYRIDLATEVHPVLGLSPQISLGLCL